MIVPLTACSTPVTGQASGTDGIETISADGTGTDTATTAAQTSTATTTTMTGSATTAPLTSGSADSSGADTDPSGADTTAADSSTGGDGVCETVLCGGDQTCCAEGDECVLGDCLPACDSGVRCGEAQDVCCGGGQVCLGDMCADPTGKCVDSFDCDAGEFCEPTLDQCLPQFDPVDCELIPDFQDVTVAEEWSYETQEVISIPVVGDIDADGVPEVVINETQLDGLGWPGGAITVLDGQTGAVELQVPNDPDNDSFGSHGRSTIGLADVSGDGTPDIIYAGRPAGGSLIHAIDGDGNLLWSSHNADGSEHRFSVENGAPSFANFDSDPEAEIVFGATLIDDDGLVVWDQGGNGAPFGTNSGYTGGISSLVDLTGDGYPEVVSGSRAWSVSWVEMAGMDPTVTVTEFWDAGGNDGYPAIADLDLDGTPEVVIVASGSVRVLEGDSGLAWCGVDPTEAMCNADPGLRTAAAAIPGGGRGGPPTIADFDGDGRPEIAAAGGSSYTVYDLYRAGEEIEGVAAPQLGDIFALWSRTTQDQSSNATGSSVFDFQGDGAAEVVYADECFLRVYDGSTGDELLSRPNSSATIHEYPLVVDVDDDGNSEILVVANDSGATCTSIPMYTERRGVFVLGDAFDQWVGTRRVWPSHAYHVTDATSVGHIPAAENDNWLQPGLNNYRQNVQGSGVFNAPDLAVDLVAGLGQCESQMLEIVATVRNAGSLGVPSGIEVSLYEGSDAMGTLVGTQSTAVALLPGAQTQLTWTVPFSQGDPALDFFVVVDGADIVASEVSECDETNNDAQTLSAECLFPG